MSIPVALVLRHGEASANAMGIFRSWLDVPLTQRGIQQAEHARDFLKKYKIKDIIASPLLRAFVTADIVAQPHKLPVWQHRGLFPWSLGVFTSLSKDENQEALHLFVENPGVAIPEGESLEQFESRQFAFWCASLKMSREKGLTLFVCHNSAITALSSFMGYNPLDPSGKENVKPGGIVEIYWDGAKHSMNVVFGRPEPAVFGGS